MAAKMVVSMCYIIVLLLVTLMAFGVSRQAITFPHEKWNWLLVRCYLSSHLKFHLKKTLSSVTSSTIPIYDRTKFGCSNDTGR
ncbi:hypothetical protein ANCDUO_01512 [Ancylostoma duodenale]|uniref:Transmembrane protein n=1 Tax=Ancylostoma duodenale TaxID=51022 RepID=A0A0C2DDY9_9BILA|nr:hypothetical protein ANCDUO_01512 [Ancylostoma duodenale]